MSSNVSRPLKTRSNRPDRSATAARLTQSAALERIRSQRTIVRPFTGPVREAIQKAFREVAEAEAGRNPGFARALESYERFRQ